MFLSSMGIEQYRSCLKTNIIFNRHLTVLIGVNGAGKSNILNAILLLKKAINDNPFRNYAPSNRCIINADFVSNSSTLHFKGIINYEMNDRNSEDIYNIVSKYKLDNIHSSYSKWISIPQEVFMPSIRNYRYHNSYSSLQRYIFTTKRVSPTRIRSKEILPKTINGLISHIDPAMSFLSSISYYSASQFSNPSKCPVSLELEEGRLINKYSSSDVHEKFILDLFRSWRKKNDEYHRYVNAIGANGIGLVDKIDFKEFILPSYSYKVLSGGKLKTINKSRSIVIPFFHINGGALSPNQLSEGTFKTLALLFYVLTDNSYMLLIEEPEVCIHHGLLKSIIDIIKFQSKHKQIVISTHSEFVLDNIEPDNIVLVENIPNKGTKAKRLPDSLKKSEYKALKQYLSEAGSLGDYWKEGGLNASK